MIAEYVPSEAEQRDSAKVSPAMLIKAFSLCWRALSCSSNTMRDGFHYKLGLQSFQPIRNTLHKTHRFV
jgi:hypothetical protein